jgi:acetyl esterase/lipase
MMSAMPDRLTEEQIAPDLREPTRKLVTGDPTSAAMRMIGAVALRVMRFPIAEGVAVRSAHVGRNRLRIYEPRQRERTGALMWIHGGGLILGDARQDDPLCSGTAAALGIPVISVNYRLAPRHPFPAPLDDVHAGWMWLQAHAESLGIDQSRVAIGGESAGAGLAAALTQRIRDEGGIQPTAQWLFAPMLDDRTAADTSLDDVHHFVWNNGQNRFGWSSYLGGPVGADTAPSYSVPARTADLSGLPPAFIAVGSIELFRAEDEAYAARLHDVGGDVTFDLVEGAPHGFENWARDTPSSIGLLQRARDWLAPRV